MSPWDHVVYPKNRRIPTPEAWPAAASEVVVSADAWKRLGARLWSELPAGRIYIARRPSGACREVAVAAQYVGDVLALVRHIWPDDRSMPSLTLVHATRPSAVLAAAAAMGGLAGSEYLLDDGFPNRLDAT